MEELKEFQQLITTNSIRISNNEFNKIFNSYKFIHIIDKSQINYEIISIVNNSQIIIIDSSTIQKNNYFIFVFEKTILIILKSDFDLIHLLFSKINVMLCFMTKEIMDSVQNINFIPKRQTDYYNIISHFSETLELKSQNTKAISFWNSIRKCICGYLIEKCIIKCNVNRIRNFCTEKVDFNKEIKSFEYQEIAYLDSSLYIIYLIEKERLAVLKRPTNDQYNNDHAIKREINNYKELNHPLLLHYYGYTIIENQECPIFEYINGCTLDEIKQMNLTNFDKIIIIFELILIVHYLHSHGFIYRDLKPDNVMIDQNKTLILIDLDRMILNKDAKLSKLTNDFGNNIFTAPEIYSKLNDYTNKVDIYSLGMMIIYIICNEVKFSDKNDRFDNFPLKELCQKCINENNPELRPSISDILNDFYSIFFTEKIFDFEFDFGFSNLIQILENDKNDAKTLYTIGCIYLDDILVPLDINKSIHYFTLSSNQGEVKSHKKLAQIYMNEKYIKRDINKGIHYMSLIADKGDAQFQYLLGFHYSFGREIQPDINKAIYYFQLSADQQFVAAYYWLGKLYLLKKEIAKSIHYLTLSLDNDEDNQASQYLLGKIYSKEKYHNLNLNKAIYYFQKLSNFSINTSLGQHQLGKIYKKINDFEKSIYYFQLAANQNNAKSQYHLGLIYFDRKDFNQAIHYLTLAAKQDHTKAQELLGIIYSRESYYNMNLDFAFYYLKLAADKNSPRAQTLLATFYLSRDYSQENIDKFFYYINLAANQNYIPAQFYLGSIYFENTIVKRDLNKSLFYLKLAADKGAVEAQNNLGLIYRDHLKDANQAIHYLLLASKQNNSYALNNLGEMYLKGILVPRDVKRAIHYYTLSANLNDFIAQNSLGRIYSNEIYKQIDIKKAIYYFSLAAEQNNTCSLYNLGLIYLEGIYVKQDLNKSIYYFTRASNLGNDEAMCNLSYIYLNEKLHHQDIEKAIYFATKAALFNNNMSQFVLGFIYSNKKFHRQDFKKAVEYFKLSAQNQNIDAYFPLAFLYHEGKYICKDINQAIHYYKESSSYNKFFAKNNLGVIYKRGDGVNINIPNAIIFFEEALKLKIDQIASYNLAHIFFYGENVNIDFEKSMNLLIKSFNNNDHYFVPNIYLLSLIIVKKVHPISAVNIRKELEQSNCNKANYLCIDVYNCIQFFNLEDSIHYDDLYFKYIDVDFLYDLDIQPIRFDKLKFNNCSLLDIISKSENVNKNFYEGLGKI